MRGLDEAMLHPVPLRNQTWDVVAGAKLDDLRQRLQQVEGQLGEAEGLATNEEVWRWRGTAWVTSMGCGRRSAGKQPGV